MAGDVDRRLRTSGFTRIAGVDEAGRGACAGPLVISAVIFENLDIPQLRALDDSKRLSAQERERLFEVIVSNALAFSIIEISAAEIDDYGLHKSNLAGMRRAVQALDIPPDYVLTDGYAIEGLEVPSLGVWKGDQTSIAIAAASILAKVHRDHLMMEFDQIHPGYGLSKHKGYLTSYHRQALLELGPTSAHRHSFKNIAALLQPVKPERPSHNEPPEPI